MKLPRDISGKDLARILKTLGYKATRQTGSHLRLTTLREGEHPDHDSLHVGTLVSILSDVAVHFEISRERLMRNLFKRM